MDADAIVVGSGFGGAVTACRLAEAGMRVIVLERGRRWSSDPKSPNFFPRVGGPVDRWVWDHQRPEKFNGWLDFRLFPSMAVVQGAGVGGGSLVYANVSVRAHPHVFEGGWPPEVTYAGLQPYYDRVGEMLGVNTVPQNQWSGRTKLMRDAAAAVGEPGRFRPLEVAVSFDPDHQIGPGLPTRPDNPVMRPNRFGVPQGTCYHCGQCDIGCDVNARNTLDNNYLARAEQKGAKILPLRLVSHVAPEAGGYRVHSRPLGGADGAADGLTARVVVLAAGSLGSTELLLRSRDEFRTLPGVGPALGRGWSSNGDFLTPAVYPDRDVAPSTGLTISSALDYHDASRDGQRFWVQDGGFPDVLARAAQALGAAAPRWLKAAHLIDLMQHWLRHDPSHHVMPWFAQGVDAADGTLRMRKCMGLFGRPRLHLDWDVSKSRPLFDAIARTHRELAEATGGTPHVPLAWSLAGSLITPHPLGGCGMGSDRATAVVDHAGEVFGHPGLYVADGAVFPRAIGVNPSRTIAALAERTAELIVAGTGSTSRSSS